MSILYLGSDPRSLADQLAEQIDAHTKAGDLFTPTTIVVPNRFVKKWLRLFLARRLDVAINLSFQNLEESLWELLKEVDPDKGNPETIDDNVYRLLILSILLEEEDPDLAPLRRYLQLDGNALTRLTCRRAWSLADRLGARIRDYEYMRQDALIQRWLDGELGLGNGGSFQQSMERAQRAVFRHIIREPDGRRALLGLRDDRHYKTFPQFAMELMTAPARRIRPSERVVHFFGFTHMTELHARVLAWLGKRFDVRYYHLNVAASRFHGNLPTTADELREPSEAESIDPGRELLRVWGRAGAEALTLVSRLKTDGHFKVVHANSDVASSDADTVLHGLQAQLLGHESGTASLTQDTSLQIVGCPGVAREVETVYNSILHNLQNDSSLKQTDIAVLVTDMPKYRAALQAVFERPPKRLQYNMVDFNAADSSTFGQAVLGMLDLALESFSRSRVFQVILNPCFLARLGVTRAEAMTWLDWAASLGIYRGWDADEKHEQGYPRSPFYAWRLGLQRLRLGRFMEVPRDDAGEPATRFGHVIPYADIASGDREQLDAFCRAVEGLLPTLARLRKALMSGERWARTLERLIAEFLEAPENRPEEGQVRADLLKALTKLASWDDLREANQSAGLPLALVREYVYSQLDVLPGSHGEYLTGGVMISALQPMRPLPFQIVYVLGLGEDSFPGSNALSSFDLRSAERLSGDVRPAESRLYDFLATVLSARQKLYLLYNNHDLQKDQALLPAAPLQQMQRYLNDRVLQGAFQPVSVPMHGDDARFLEVNRQPAHQDVLIQMRDADRWLALRGALGERSVKLDSRQQAEWQSKGKHFEVQFEIAAAPAETVPAAVTITLGELRRFLQLPAQESLRRHLRLDADGEPSLDDDEPLITTQQAANALVRQALDRLVRDSAANGVQQALASWQERFDAAYADSRLRSLVPEDAFGAIDRSAIVRDLHERIHGQGGLEAFLRERAGMTFCGPVLLGESATPVGAKLRFPALRLRPGHELPASATQEIRLVGATPFAWNAPGRFELLIVTNYKTLDDREIHPAFLEPALLQLALQANAEANADGLSSQRMLESRELALHIAWRQGIRTWTYAPGSVTAAEALHYFVELTRDYLEAEQFDLLPFDVLNDKKDLQAVMHDDAAPFTPEEFRAALAEAIEDVRDNAFSTIQMPLLVEMVNAQVPADALAKVQRRFRLLDRGPASNRRGRVPSRAKR